MLFARLIHSRFTRLAVFIAILALFIVAPAIAQGEPPIAPDDGMVSVPTITEALGMLASGLAVGTVTTFLFERFEWFQKRSSSFRWWFVFLFSLLAPLVAQILLLNVPAEVWEQVQPYWNSLALGFVAWAGSQLVHKLVNKRAVTNVLHR